MDRVTEFSGKDTWRGQPPLSVEAGGEILGEQVEEQWVLGSAEGYKDLPQSVNKVPFPLFLRVLLTAGQKVRKDPPTRPTHLRNHQRCGHKTN